MNPNSNGFRVITEVIIALALIKVLLCYFLTIIYLESAKVTLERVQTLNSKEGKILGTSKVGPKYRVTLVKEVQKRLKVEVGDVIVYLEEPDEKIVLETVSYEQLLKTTKKITLFSQWV